MIKRRSRREQTPKPEHSNRQAASTVPASPTAEPPNQNRHTVASGDATLAPSGTVSFKTENGEAVDGIANDGACRPDADDLGGRGARCRPDKVLSCEVAQRDDRLAMRAVEPTFLENW